MELNKALYTLAEAAEILSSSQSSILARAVTGACHCYVRVQSELDVYSVAEQHVFGRPQSIKGEDRQQFIRRIARLGPHRPASPVLVDVPMLLLEVSKEQCEFLRATDYAEQSVFDSGLKVMSDGTTERYEAAPRDRDDPLATSPAPYSGVRKFAIYKSRAMLRLDDEDEAWRITSPLVMTLQNVLIRRDELLEMKLSPTALRQRFSEDVPLSYSSSKGLSAVYAVLLDLHVAALETGTRKLPAREDIEKLLRPLLGDSERLAQCGAALIIDSSTKPGSDGQLHLHAPSMVAVIGQAARWLVVRATSGKPLVNSEISDALKKEHKLQDYVANASASLIRPSWASNGRPKKPQNTILDGFESIR